ncbi:MAG: AAA family ATPase [Clostridia bacterium]|nr:AAA family ATPase [Clostridia bacterium]
MHLMLNYRKKLESICLFVLDKLPTDLKQKLEKYLLEKGFSTVNEIRIRAGSYICLFIDSKAYVTDIWVSNDLINETLICLCDGSVYAHLNTIRKGYISIGKGVRAGICGKAVLENELISGISSITSINIRIPQKISFAAEYLHELLKAHDYNISVLLYSPPGVGKTTILRDLVCRLSSTESSIRHAVIDTREEITTFLENTLTSDIYLSYPKGLGIELATKSMTPKIIICDEITSLEEANAIMNSVLCGVSLIATTHASSYEELKSKEILQSLFNCDAFDYSLGVQRSRTNKFIFTLNKIK